LLISIPLGYFAGIGFASRKGILIKGSNFIDEMNLLNTVVFDKTGTLTKGTFKVLRIVSRNSFTEEEILKYAAYAESHSNHPIAVSIKEAYKKDIDQADIEKYEEISGYGVKAKVKGCEIIAGNDRLLHKEKIDHTDCEIKDTVVYVAADNNYAGYIIIGDQEKEDAGEAVSGLRKLGIKNIAMFTGDNKNAAAYYSEKFGMDYYYSELLPEEKLDKLKEIKNTAFVGDGINDAPVIAEADVGFAMGKLGSDAAIETADVVLMTDAPSKVTEAVRIAKKTKGIITQNIVLVLLIKLIFICFGAFGLSGMWEALFADVGVTLLAVLNTLRLLK
jgi:Zn2+/Cd2+-exporting ATPase